MGGSPPPAPRADSPPRSARPSPDRTCMLRTLIRKDLLANLLTLRLVVALVFTVVLCLLTTVMGSLDFSSNAEEYRGVLADNAAGPQTTTYQHVYVTVFCPPQPLHMLSRGMMEGWGLWGWFNADRYSRGLARFGFGYTDDLLAVLVRVDFTSVVALVLTFLAVVLGFDSICGEWEQGTLRLLLSYSVTRGQVVTAKLAGGVVPLAVAYCGSLLILLANPDVVLSGDDWVRLGDRELVRENDYAREKHNARIVSEAEADQFRLGGERFAQTATRHGARLGAVVVRWTFDKDDFHILHLAGWAGGERESWQSRFRESCATRLPGRAWRGCWSPMASTWSGAGRMVPTRSRSSPGRTAWCG